MKVSIPQPLLGYTAQQSELEADGATLADLLGGLDGRFPGIRFRIVNEHGALRPHVRIFVNRRPTIDLTAPLAPSDEIHILQALSGG